MTLKLFLILKHSDWHLCDKKITQIEKIGVDKIFIPLVNLKTKIQVRTRKRSQFLWPLRFCCSIGELISF